MKGGLSSIRVPHQRLQVRKGGGLRAGADLQVGEEGDAAELAALLDVGNQGPLKARVCEPGVQRAVDHAALREERCRDLRVAPKHLEERCVE